MDSQLSDGVVRVLFGAEKRSEANKDRIMVISERRGESTKELKSHGVYL